MTNFSIQSVSQETGIPKETLRKWEERFGYPNPSRDDSGNRLYSDADLKKLRLIRQLRDHRFPLTILLKSTQHELEGLINGLSSCCTPFVVDSRLHNLAALLQASKFTEFEQNIDSHLEERGPAKFILEICAAMTYLVGNEWQTGLLNVHQEHVYSHIISKKLKSIEIASYRAQKPTILLTTLSGEQHFLGLLMAEIFFKLSNCRCISLGPNTPSSEIVLAASSQDINIVGLSFTTIKQPTQIRKELSWLRERLPKNVEIWTGGDGTKQLNLPLQLAKRVGLEDIDSHVSTWRSAHHCSAE